VKIAILVALLAISDNATEAGVRFKRGLELYQQGRVRDALEQFLVSYRLSANPNLAFNIGTCFEELKNYDAAFSAYSEYLEFELTPEEQSEGELAMARIIPEVARISIETDPPGAAIYLDRKNLGQYGNTPRTFAAPAGAHEVILTLPGHLPASRSVVLVRGQATRLSLVMAQQRGTVEVSSDPAGAEIRLGDAGGELLGTTPASIELPIGARQLHLHAEGHADETRSVEVRVDQKARLFVAHRPLPPETGQLRILTNVPSALISVDGREVGFSPLVLDLPVGDHGVTVHQPGYRAWTQVVSIASDRPLAAEVTLEPKQQEVGRGPWPWVLLTTTAVAVVVALGLSIEALRSGDAFDAEPTPQHFDRTRTLNIAADVMWGTALLGGTASAATFFFGEESEERDSSGTIVEVQRLEAPRSPAR
jgi:hypothetical protein